MYYSQGKKNRVRFHRELAIFSLTLFRDAVRRRNHRAAQSVARSHCDSSQLSFGHARRSVGPGGTAPQRPEAEVPNLRVKILQGPSIVLGLDVAGTSASEHLCRAQGSRRSTKQCSLFCRRSNELHLVKTARQRLSFTPTSTRSCHRTDGSRDRSECIHLWRHSRPSLRHNANTSRRSSPRMS